MSHPPAGVDDCPHRGHCTEETGCHDGSILREIARYTEERDGWWFALTWAGPRGPTHEAKPGAGPRLAQKPKWAK